MKYIIALIVIIAFGFVAIYFFMPPRVEQNNNQTEEANVADNLYKSHTYGYYFEIPSGYETNEYTEESVSVGHSTGPDAFMSVADVRVYTAGPEVGYPNYEGFVFDTLRNMCAADGPNESIYCDQVEQQEPFAANSGMNGEMLYLHRVHEVLDDSATSTYDTFGPVFIFNMSANVSDAQFAFLAIQPPANLPTAEVDSDLLRSIAHTVEIERVEGAQNATSTLALVSDIRTENGQTVVEFDSVQMLTGEAALEAAAEDTDCDMANAADCVPSLNNNFYIRNTKKETDVYPVRSDATITIQENAEPTEATIGDVDERITTLGKMPFEITFSGREITALEEVYVP